MTDALENPIFHDQGRAREWLEALVWPTGATCPHCGNDDEAKVVALQGESHRAGLYQCAGCREQFTVTVKTVFESSKIPLNKWLLALFLMTTAKDGISVLEVHRVLGVSYKSTWYMMHRLREAMCNGGLMARAVERRKSDLYKDLLEQIKMLQDSPDRKGRRSKSKTRDDSLAAALVASHLARKR